MKKENSTTNCPSETKTAKNYRMQNNFAIVSADHASGNCDREQEIKKPESRFKTFMKMMVDHFTNGKLTAYTFYY
jgi:hypothetical protein